MALRSQPLSLFPLKHLPLTPLLWLFSSHSRRLCTAERRVERLQAQGHRLRRAVGAALRRELPAGRGRPRARAASRHVTSRVVRGTVSWAG